MVMADPLDLGHGKNWKKKTPKTKRNWMILKETGRNRKKQEKKEETERNRKKQEETG